MSWPHFVKIVEVSPRDGLQNEKSTIDTDIKIEFINQLSETGLSVIEATSFVSPKRISQLADHVVVFEGIRKKSGVAYPVLVPNIRGLEEAFQAGVKEVAVFTSPSEQFCQHNIHCSVQESIERITEVIHAAKQHHIKVRGYLSCVLGCPYEGEISPESVVKLAKKLIDLGCDEISLGDTIGVGTPLKTKQLLTQVIKAIPREQLAVHFHDTYGQALVNIYAALEMGIQVIDSSVAGLGGCPYARGASGNVATEEVLYLLQGLGIETGVDLKKIIAAGRFIIDHLKKPMGSKVNQAFSK